MTRKGASRKPTKSNVVVFSPRSLWTFLGSARFAVFALAIIAFFSAIGTLVPQNESHDFYIHKYGSIVGKLIVLLAIDNLYYTYWFIILLIIMAINLIISNIKRLKSNIHSNRELKIDVGIPFFEKSSKSVRISATKDREHLHKIAESSLRLLGYHLKKKEKNEETYYYAEKGKVRRWGSLITHTGILIILLGVIYGHFPGMGFKGMAIMAPVPEYSIFTIKEAGFSLRLLNTASKQDELGHPPDYYSQVEVLDDNKKILEKVIRVNDPLEYKGVKFYQSSFGIAGFKIEVNDEHGKKYMIPIFIRPEGTQIPTSPIQVGKTDIFIFLHNIITEQDESDGKTANHPIKYDNPAALIFLYENFNIESQNQWKARGWISRERALKYKGYTIKMGDLINYTGLQYRKDPGVPLVWMGFLFTTLGLFTSFYISEKTIRLLILPCTGKHNIFIQTYSHTEESFDREIETLQKNIEEC